MDFENIPVDIVLPWVDNSDPKWRKEFETYSKTHFGDNREIRYRDWDTLRYVFRGIDKFMPWVRTVHFVTCGHTPDWLKMDAPRLNYVRHSDFIPHQYLPTFSINPIEMNLFRIKELADKFIYFNDDTFVINEISKGRFFHNGLPCDYVGFNVISPNSQGIEHIICNDVSLINEIFNKRQVLTKNLRKFFSLQLISGWYRTSVLLPWRLFTGFVDPHLPNAYLKSTFATLWERFPDVLNQTSLNKFRSFTDVNQYLARYYQICSGEFYPYNVWKDSRFYQLSDDSLPEICRDIIEQKKKVICINDSINIKNVNDTKTALINSFQQILPDKSSFEK